jgi:multicomponent K+:H+ antiporter subunit E
MKKLCPFPVLSVTLAATWLVLEGLSPLHLALASLFAIAIPLACAPFFDALPGLRSVTAAVRLIGRVLWDIIVANVVVARLVLGPVSRLRPAFVEVPLTVTNPYAITLFASIVSIVPGSVSLAFTADARTLLLHVLHVEDGEQFVAMIKERYERPLMEILQC